MVGEYSNNRDVQSTINSTFTNNCRRALQQTDTQGVVSLIGVYSVYSEQWVKGTQCNVQYAVSALCIVHCAICSQWGLIDSCNVELASAALCGVLRFSGHNRLAQPTNYLDSRTDALKLINMLQCSGRTDRICFGQIGF